MQISIFISIFFSLLSFRLLLSKDFNNKYIFYIIVFTICSALSFSFGLCMPTFFLLFIIFNEGLSNPKKKNRGTSWNSTIYFSYLLFIYVFRI